MWVTNYPETIPQSSPKPGQFARHHLGLGLALLAVLAWSASALVTFHHPGFGTLDLRIYRNAGATLFRGTTYVRHFSDHLSFTYPPFALLVVSPLSLPTLLEAQVLWWILNAACLVIFVYLALREATTIRARAALTLAVVIAGVAQIAFEPVRSNTDFGQINVFLMTLVIVDITCVRGKFRGALTGLAAAIKLTPLLYLFFFLLSRDARSMLRGTLAFLSASGLAWLILPRDSRRYWLHDFLRSSRAGNVNYLGNQSWYALANRAPFHGDTLGTMVWVIAEVVTLGVGLLTAKRLIDAGKTIEALLALALTEVLISPISWTHHWSWVTLIPVVLISRWNRSLRGCRALLFTLAIVVVGPYWIHVRGWPAFFLSNSLVLTGAFLLAAMFVGALKEPSRVASPTLSAS